MSLSIYMTKLKEKNILFLFLYGTIVDIYSNNSIYLGYALSKVFHSPPSTTSIRVNNFGNKFVICHIAITTIFYCFMVLFAKIIPSFL